MSIKQVLKTRYSSWSELEKEIEKITDTTEKEMLLNNYVTTIFCIIKLYTKLMKFTRRRLPDMKYQEV